MTSIIILSYNTKEMTELCLESIRKYTEPGSYELIVIDNASKDGSREWLRTQADVRLIENEQNVGFPKGCNQGLAVARGEYLLLLNSDTVVTPRWLDQLLTALTSRREIGAVGPVSNKVSNLQQILVPYCNVPQDLDRMEDFAERYNHSDPAKWERRLRLIGFCFLFTREVYEKLGGLDEGFGMGNAEDDDYSLRIWQAGYECILCRDTFIHHFGSSSFKHLDKIEKNEALAQKKFAERIMRNSQRLKKKWHLPEQWVYGGLRDIFPGWQGPEVVKLADVKEAYARQIEKDQQLATQMSKAIDAKDLTQVRELLTKLAAHEVPSGVDLYLMGEGLLLLGETEAAEKLLHEAEQAPIRLDWLIGAIASSLARLYQKTGRVREAVPYFQQSIQHKEIDTGLLAEYSNYLFHVHYLNAPQQEYLSLARDYGKLLGGIPAALHPRVRRHARLRIGYVSADFGRHIVSAFTWHLWHGYDRVNFAVYCYMNGTEDAASEEIKGLVTAWRNVKGAPFAQIAQQIQKDEIDILVDLSGHTAGNLLPVFAYRPAPVQVSTIGYFDTTGVPGMDYVLTDEVVAPRKGRGANDAYFTEKLWRLPVSHLCYMWHDRPPAPMEAPSRRTGFITFGCFQNFAKCSDGVLAAWREILARVPGSRLFLKMAVFQDPYAQRLATERLRAAGIDTARVDVAPTEPDYLGAYHAVDIVLDTFPYPGGGSTCDALYMGVPVVTLVGERYGARFGAGLLHYAGHEELVAETVEAYIEKAVALAGDAERLEHYHETLRRDLRASRVMDGAAYLMAVEEAYQQMYARWLYGGDARKEKKAQKKLTAELKEAFRAQNWAHAVELSGALSGLAHTPREVESFADEAAIAYLHLGDFSRLASWLPRASQRRRNRSAYYHWLLGMAARKNGKNALAAAEFAQAEVSEATEQGEMREAFLADLWTQQAAAQLAIGDIDDGEAALGGVRPPATNDEHEHLGAMHHYLAASQRAVTLADRCEMYSSFLMTCHHREIPPEQMLKYHLRFDDIFQGKVKSYPHTLDGHTHERLRIGFISPDFRQNVMFYFYYQLLAGADHTRFALYAYSRGATKDGFTGNVQRAVDVFRDVQGLSYEETAAQIAADEIDVLVDLAGHAANSGLPVLAYRPAPVQVSGLGYMGTTGLSTVDYLLTDAVCDPEEAPRQITEQPLYLPSLFCYTGRTDVPAPKGAPCRLNGYVTFGIFNRWQKVTDEFLSVLLRLSAQVPDAHFLFKGEAYGDDALASAVYEKLKTMGFDMAHVTLEPASADYLARYQEVDIALDTYPYVGGGTTCDALYMGVPVVARYGAGRGTRYAASILKAAGLGEMAAASWEDYLARAIALAGDSELLDTLHRSLRQMVMDSRLMDTRQYVAAFYTQCEKIFGAWRDEQRE